MSNINVVRKNLGPVTAYKYAVQQGYTGTEQEFAALMASYATVAEEAEAAKDDAIDAKTAAEEAQAAAEAAAEQAEGAIEVDDTLSVEGRAADAKAVGDKISVLKADLTQVSENLMYANLYNISARSNKYIDKNSGNTSDNNVYVLSDYIAVTAGNTYYTGNIFLVVWFASDKSYVGYSEITVVFSTVTAPSGASYARIQYTNAIPHLSVFFGSTNTVRQFKIRTSENVGIITTYDDYNIVYSRFGGTEKATKVNNTPEDGSIPIYDANKNIKSSAPVADNDVTRKVDLDTLSSAIKTAEAESAQIMFAGDMRNVYEKVGTSGANGTKSYSNGDITLTPVSGRASASYINYIFGSSSNPLTAYRESKLVKNTVVVDLWYSTESTKYRMMIRFSQAPQFDYTSLPSGTYKHIRAYLDLTEKTLQHIGIQYNADTATEVEPITVHKMYVWYGHPDNVNPIIFTENTIRPVTYKKILSIGDSLTNVVNPTGTNYVGDWQAIVANILHIPNTEKLGIAGTALSKFPATGDDADKSIYAKIQALSPDPDVDLITLWGGTNDWHTVAIELSDFETQLPRATRNDSTFYGGALTDVETLITKFPNARIVIIGTTPRSWSNNTLNCRTTPNGNGKYLQEYNDALKEIAEYYGLAFIDMMKTSGINVLNITDYMVAQTDANDGTTYYLHFNALGEQTVGNRLAHFIASIG